MPTASLRALLSGSIDYAGLFPPAALTVTAACQQYGAALDSEAAWTLGRFVVPASRILELSSLVPAGHPPWRIAVLLGDDVAHDVHVVDEVSRHGTLLIEAAEVRTSSVAAIVAATNALRASCHLYAEIAAEPDPAELVAAVAAAGARAKLRTGGLVQDAFPPAAAVARFIACCHAHAVPFKATAGLHHALRGDYRLTYDLGSARATMFGFLNLFVAAALARAGASQASITAALDERDAAAFRFSAHDIRWRDFVLPVGDVVAMRESFALSFGSCSFTEPVAELQQLGLL